MLSSTSAARRAALLALPGLALAAGCGHSKPAASAATPTVAASSPTAAATTGSANADFGTVKSVCGPGTGTPVPSTARGVTATEIKVGVLNDATNTLVPGLGKSYLDVAKSFSTWCNAAGGINGRKITFVSRDAKLTEAAKAVIDACQSDFMLVGGGTPFDAPTVGARSSCGMGSIPAYVVSPEVVKSGQQALPTAFSSTEANVGALRLLQATYGNAFKRTAQLAVDNPSLLAPSLTYKSALPKGGATITSFQKIPTSVTNYRTYVQPLVGRADALIPSPAPNVDFFRAMHDVGYTPKVILDPVGNTYGPDLVTALKGASVTSPYYLALRSVPVELAAGNGTYQKALGLSAPAQRSKGIDPASWSAWLLWAQSATACTAQLSVDCVIGKATAQTTWTAGGLTVPVDLSDPQKVSPCVLLMSVTKNGYKYEKALTKPTDGLYNCEPANVVKVNG